ncbi:MAG: glycosyltransferase family 2 protein [Bacillota bacterium]
MSVPRALYLFVYSVYIVFFILFLRFYVWRRYTQKNFWQKRPVLSTPVIEDLCTVMGREVPFVSIIIPARDESDVIENTVRHISGLQYPKDRFEVLVVTDEKEVIRARTVRKKVISRLRRAIAGRTSPEAGPAEADEDEQYRSILLYALAYLCSPVSDANRVFELCRTAEEDPRLAAEILSSAPDLGSLVNNVFALYQTLIHWEEPAGQKGRDWLRAALLPDFSLDAIEAIRLEAAGKLRIVGKERFNGEMMDALVRLHPTTQEVLDRILAEPDEDKPQVKHIIVPNDYDGKWNGSRTGHTVPSTKGRALNWVLRYLDPRSEACGFYDAESRPHQDAIAYVAYRRLLDPGNARIFQGPVFQVRNFYQMGLFCRIASLYQAVAHDWYLPWLFRTLPFVGGTNLFVDRRLLESLGGWDYGGLTEDLEFGTRAYLQTGAWPQYLPYPSSEQTPPNYKAFFRQRLRWATGHLQVVDKVANTRFVPEDRRRELLFHLILKGQFEWVVYQMATFVPPIALVLQYSQMLDETAVPAPARWLLMFFSVIYFSFTFYAFARYRPYFDRSHEPDTLLGQAGVLVGLLILPLAAFLFPVPFTSALVLKALGKEPKNWVKTPRTRERTV